MGCEVWWGWSATMVRGEDGEREDTYNYTYLN
jgi:hypothetical protein